MNHSLKLTCMALRFTLASTLAQAQTPKTREQVRQELAEAQRDGTIVYGDLGLPMRELFPASYPKAPVVAGRTRAEVRAELAEAQRTGDLFAGGEIGFETQRVGPRPVPEGTLQADGRSATRGRPDSVAPCHCPSDRGRIGEPDPMTAPAWRKYHADDDDMVRPTTVPLHRP